MVVVYDFEGIMAGLGNRMVPIRLEWRASVEKHSRVDDSVNKRDPDQANQDNLPGVANANPDEK